MTQDNRLITASYKLTLNEKRLMLLAIAKVNPLLIPSEVYPFRITADDWLEAYPGSANPYQDIVRATNKLLARHVFIDRCGQCRKIPWLAYVEYREGEIDLVLNELLKPYLCGYLEQFTSYNLLDVQQLKSIHSIRLYENLMMFKTTHWRKWLLPDFREIFAPDGQYQAYKALRQEVITPAVEEINLKTPLNVTYEPHKQGRSIVAVSFKFKEKTTNQKKKIGIGTQF